MTRAPLFALRALWAHGGAAQAFVARDQRVSDAIARSTRDFVPDFVRHDGNAVQTLAATIGLDQILRASVAPDETSGGTDTHRDERGARDAGATRRAGRPAAWRDEVAGGTPIERSGAGDAQGRGAWERGASGATTHVGARRERTGQREGGAPGISEERVGSGDVRSSSTHAPAIARSVLRGETRGADGRAPITPVGRVGQPAQPQQPEHAGERVRRPPFAGAASDTLWRAVAPLAPTLTDEARRQVASQLARYGPDVASSARSASSGDGHRHAAPPGENGDDNLSSLLMRVLDRLERRRAGHSSAPRQSALSLPDNPSANAPFPARVDSPMDARSGAASAVASPGITGFRALASRAHATDDVPGIRAPFLHRDVARETSQQGVSESGRDVHSVLVAAARAEGLDLEEVTS